ncbi:hypothetical protein ACFVIM_16105 [Streptomyces sp. NPDC057638]|uniref:hypothetical protein n=1 Tax=Streptomyces sp. NPDC057638 TaxID=3346190 RepID=UPI0036843232
MVSDHALAVRWSPSHKHHRAQPLSPGKIRPCVTRVLAALDLGRRTGPWTWRPRPMPYGATEQGVSTPALNRRRWSR